LFNNGFYAALTQHSVLFASWDAEEYGLVGSTEWGEDFPEWISEHAVAYLNVDVSVSGSRWNVFASPSLADLIKRTALDVPHPTEPGKTLWDARDDVGPFSPPNGSLSGNMTIDSEYLARYEMESAAAKEIGPLGSGSDYTVFLQRLGVSHDIQFVSYLTRLAQVASVDQGFGGTPFDAPYHYHSVYDSQRWQEVYADPDFSRHVGPPSLCANMPP
jgi:N-acetylated-alpha-linked acidic dipeptidase